MRTLAGDIRTWAALAALSLIVGIMGPFGTFEIPAVARLAYWTTVVLATATTGTLVAGVLERVIGDRLPRLLRAAVAGALAGPPIVLVVVLINAAAFGLWFRPIDLVTLTSYCALISACITALTVIMVPPQVAVAAEAQPALLERIPLPQRGRLIHLEVADHYVQVTTERGRTMLLLRLSDAIRETAPVPGLQVHRSHWVALDAVRRATRQSGKPVLELENGAVIPVSRSYLNAVKAAGLLL